MNWFERNAKSEQYSIFRMPRKKKDQEDEWEVRKTFKYNSAVQYADIYKRLSSFKRRFIVPESSQHTFIGDEFITSLKSTTFEKNDKL